MNWDAIGAIAEMLGALAVIITLLFLVLQIRGNAAMIQNATLQDQSTAVADWSRQLTTNPDLHLIYRSGLSNTKELSKEDLGRFDLVLLQAFQSIGGLYQQHLNGGLSTDAWVANLQILGELYNAPGGRRSWERQKHMLHPGYTTEVEKFFSDNAGQT